jgi:ATP-dependent Clp protease protease subunit
MSPNPSDDSRPPSLEQLDPAERGLSPAPVFGRLFAARQVLLFGEVTMGRAHAVTAQLLALASQSPDPITLVVHSPGGHVESADTIFDVIRFIEAPVTMLGSGWVASAGALIFVAAEKSRRLCLPNTRFLLHQPLGGVGGPATDVEIEARQITLMRGRLNRIFSEATGQSLERILKDTDRNYWLSAEEAREYGLVDRIVTCARDLF